MGSRLQFRVDLPSGLDRINFHPALLLPLINESIHNGVEPLTHGGSITLSAGTDHGLLRVLVTDDGVSRKAALHGDSAYAILRDRLRELYGDTAKLVLTPKMPHGTHALIEVPIEAARDHR